MGWKLRKDKTTTETAENESLANESLPAAASVAEAPTASDWDLPKKESARSPFDLGAETLGAEPFDADIGDPSLTDWHTDTSPISASPFDLAFQDEEEPSHALASEEPYVEPVVAAAAAPEPGEAEEAESPTMPLGRAFLPPLSTPPPMPAPIPAPLPEPPAAKPPSLPQVSPFIVDIPPQAPPSEQRHLVLRLGNLSATYPLLKDITIIGRPDSALHYYPDIEIELDDAVSRRHAEILRRGEDYFLIDEGSTNGTLLNGETLPPHQEHLLQHGDRIHVGERAEIVFE